MLDTALDTIKKYNMLSLGDRIVVGVSGGPDSMALLYFLYCLQHNYSLYIHVAHLNHMLRGQESDEDTIYVKDFCSRLGIPCDIKYVDIDELSRKEGLSLEEAGRKARYEFFTDTAKQVNASKIALAHNMNDQAETILMRIMRGTGLEGLRGIKPVRDGLYIRPFICTMRDEIEKYCENNDIKPRIDSSNLMPIYARNKVRLELIPYIKENYNGSIEYVLSSMAELISEDNDFLVRYVDSIYSQIAFEDEGRVSLSLDEISRLHNSIKKRILRQAIRKIKGNLIGIENKHIDLILNIIEKGATGAAVELPSRVRAEISYNNVIIAVNNEVESKGFSCPLNVPGITYIQEIDCVIESEILDRYLNYNDSNLFVKYFDYDKIKGNLIVRSRKEGDYFTPLGLGGKKKVKELFIDSKVPKGERDKVPIVLCGDIIVWVVGYKMSDVYKIDSNTKKILKLQFRQTGGSKHVG